MTTSARRRRWPFVVGGLVLALGILVAVFRWDWLIPVIEPRLSAALGRPVSLSHLHVALGRTTRIVADQVSIGNPQGWPGTEPFATADHLTLEVNAEKLIKERAVEMPLIQVDRPVVNAQQGGDRKANWQFASGSSTSSGGTGPALGHLVINDGTVNVKSAPLNADFRVAVQTKADAASGKDQIVADAKGTYAKQPITAAFIGGALLSLRNAADPYPISLKVENGPTRATVVGTVQDPLAFKGAKVKLTLAGPDMSLLLPLTGVAIPKTPPYQVAGQLDYGDGVVSFDDMSGKVGSSDLRGSLSVDTKPERPVLTADLESKRVDLADLGGFIGAEPGDADKGTKKAPARADGKVLPDDPISLPRLNAADVHLKYKALRIEGNHQPLDNMVVAMDIVNGDISLHPLSFGIGKGAITSQIQLSEKADALAMKANVDFKSVDLSKLLNATGVAKGAGVIGGQAVVEGTGKSMAAILGDGNGEIKLYMGSGGDLSALLVDISGLQFGNALLSALGIPNREQIQCLITDVTLRDGLAQSRLTMLDTNDSRVGITGDVNLKNERLDLTLRTQAKHFSIGSLPAPIGIDGTLGAPSIQPDLKDAGVRAAAAVGLGALLTPVAGLLPTIQFGTGDDHACAGLLREIKSPVRASGKVEPSHKR